MQAQAIADLVDEQLVTKRDLKELEAATRHDLKELEAATKRDLKELELRLTLRIGAMITAAVAVIAVLVKLL